MLDKKELSSGIHYALRFYAFLLFPYSPLMSSCPPLVLAGSLLAGLELVKVPSADVQRALVLVHALAEVVDVRGTCALLLALVAAGVVCALLEGRGLRLGGRRAGATTEEATDGVADRGTDCNTAGEC